MKLLRLSYVIVLSLTLGLSLPAWAATDNVGLWGKVTGITGKQVYLLRVNRDRNLFVDSAVVTEKSEFVFSQKLITSVGLYRVVIGQTQNEDGEVSPQAFTFIGRPGEFVKLSTTFDTPVDSMVIETGEENKRYYDFLKKKGFYTRRLDILSNMLAAYPDDCTDKKTKCLHADILKEYNTMQDAYQAIGNNALKKYPNTFVTSLIRLEQSPILDGAKTRQERFEQMKAGFLRPFDFEDTLMLHADALTNKVLKYITFYRNGQLSDEQQTAEFIKALNVLQPIAKKGSPVVYNYIINYLMDGFNQIKQDALVTYIAEHYLDNTCGMEDEKLKETLQKSADYKRTAIGATAPDIDFDNNKTVAKLYDVKANYTVVVFWASWCPHCISFLPELNTMYEKYKAQGLEVVAVSLDTEPKEWAKAVVAGNYGWVNYSDFKKWQGTAARAYNVVATPTMYLLDKDKKIIAKPSTVKEIEAELGLK